MLHPTTGLALQPGVVGLHRPPKAAVLSPVAMPGTPVYSSPQLVDPSLPVLARSVAQAPLGRRGVFPR